MTILTSADKEKIKRVIPKSSNKIIDATVVRLYISYPNPDDWNWTGLTGALVLVDDLVGHSFFFKLVDIIGNQGVLWDQELWVDFQYAQDRLYFHSFEIEEYSIGFLFEDKSDAQHFYKRVISRSKHGSKLTVQNNNSVEAKKKPEQFSNKGYRGENSTIVNEQRMRRAKGILYYDDLPPPEWRSFYKELENMGIGEDMIAENRDFIKDYISKTGGPLVGLEPPIPRKYQYQLGNNNNNSNNNDSGSLRSRSGTVSSIGSNSTANRKKKAPPPPPPTASAAASISVSSDLNNVSNSYSSPSPVDSHQSSPFNDIDEVMDTSPPSTNSPTRVTSVHRVPPPMTFPNQQQQQQQQQQQPQQQQTAQFPQLPPRGNAPLANFPPRFNMASQPSQGQTRGPVPPPPPARGPVPPQGRANAPPPPPARNGSAPPAPPSRRGNAPPPPPSRHNGSNQSLNGPPQLPPGHPQAYPTSMSPPPQQQQQYSTPIPSYEQRQTQQYNASPIPPPPPLQQSAVASIPVPPPPPAMSMGGPPAPPPPPSMAMGGPPSSTPAASMPSGAAGRDQLLASIRSSGLNSLKKVDKSQLDKPSALLQEAKGETPAPSVGGGAGMSGQSGSLADALAAALSSRKNRVAHSDDEDDGDW